MRAQDILSAVQRGGLPSSDDLTPNVDADQHRREFKFLLAPGIAAEVEREVARHLPRDPEAPGGYHVMSEYHDTAAWACYWQKKDGVPSRRCLRGRVYTDPEGRRAPACFIEIKHKLDGVTVKRRLRSSPEDWETFSAGGPLRVRFTQDLRLAKEIETWRGVSGLRPAIRICCLRRAYDPGREGGVRITFDAGIAYRGSPRLRGSDCAREPFRPLVPEGWVLLEAKIIGSAPAWLRMLSARERLVATSFSKFARAVDLLDGAVAGRGGAARNRFPLHNTHD